MRKTLLIAVMAAVGCTMAVGQAPAAPMAAPGGSAASGTLHLVANVCGRNGCVPVQTKRVVHTKPGSVAGNHI